MVFLVKVAVVGLPNTGKTALVKRIETGKFHIDTMPTLGMDVATIVDKFQDQFVKFQLWDTSGNERFRSITQSVFKNCHLVLVMVDVHSTSSLELQKYWEEVINPNSVLFHPDHKVVLVGNKADLGTLGQGVCQTFAQQKNIEYTAISTKNSRDLTYHLLLKNLPGFVTTYEKQPVVLPAYSDIRCNNCSLG